MKLIRKFTIDCEPFYCFNIEEVSAEREELRLILEEIKEREEEEWLNHICILEILESDNRELQAQLR